MDEKRTWELSLAGDCITNGIESFDPNLWGEMLRVLNALEQAKDTAELRVTNANTRNLQLEALHRLTTTEGRLAMPDNETERYLHVERWPLGDTDERAPMYCLYLADDPDDAINWLRIGDVWEQEGADYLNTLEDARAALAVTVKALRQLNTSAALTSQGLLRSDWVRQFSEDALAHPLVARFEADATQPVTGEGSEAG